MTSPTDQNDDPTTSKRSIKEIEAAFLKSKEKMTLLESLKSSRKNHEWNKKVENYASEKFNDEVTLESSTEFENYVETVTQFGVQTIPKDICSEIKEQVSKYVKGFSVSLAETYKEAMLKAAEKTANHLLKERIKNSSPKVEYINRPKPNCNKNVQIQPRIKEVEAQTFPGLGNYDDYDFDTFVNNDDIELSYPDQDEFHSDSECGMMAQNEEEMLLEKLEKLAAKQKRLEEDYEKAAESFLELLENNSDHRNIIAKIKRLTEFEMKTYEIYMSKEKDPTLPQPEILTYKWKGRFFKLVTSFSWISSNCDSQKRKKQIQATEKAYLYLQHPDIIMPSKSRCDQISKKMQPFEDYCAPSKIPKMG